uniref:Uncharacterized protein n=1 Tax=Ditylenchus dipsaci TaxID=166011 RepID=A0A915DCM4_9BILA
MYLVDMQKDNSIATNEIQEQKQESSNDPMLEAFKRGVPEVSTIKVVRKLMLTGLSREPYVMQQHTKIRRGPHDHWREYGALMKIYSIGGWKIIKKCHDKKSTQYQFVPIGSAPPNPPNRGPITSLEEYIQLSTSSMQTGRPPSQDKG